MKPEELKSHWQIHKMAFTVLQLNTVDLKNCT